jgi:hypothetical protein
MIYVPDFIRICSGIPKSIEVLGLHIQAHREQGDLIVLVVLLSK